MTATIGYWVPAYKWNDTSVTLQDILQGSFFLLSNKSRIWKETARTSQIKISKLSHDFEVSKTADILSQLQPPKDECCHTTHVLSWSKSKEGQSYVNVDNDLFPSVVHMTRTQPRLYHRTAQVTTWEKKPLPLTHTQGDPKIAPIQNADNFYLCLVYIIFSLFFIIFRLLCFFEKNGICTGGMFCGSPCILYVPQHARRQCRAGFINTFPFLLSNCADCN